MDLRSIDASAVLDDVFPHHLAVCSTGDIDLLISAVENDQSFESTVSRPKGQVADDILFTLKVAYWALKVMLLVVALAKEYQQMGKKLEAAVIEDRTREKIPREAPSPVRRNLKQLVEEVLKQLN